MKYKGTEFFNNKHNNREKKCQKWLILTFYPPPKREKQTILLANWFIPLFYRIGLFGHPIDTSSFL